ncbi:MAG TPA: hypothetical protein VD813_12065 [Pseudonocardia sp.]|nr:hypothetical protein [Pseudonocardia sp.]
MSAADEGEAVHEHERRRRDAVRRDRELMDRAAAFLRHETIRSSYAGLQHRHVAFALASILDVLSRHLPDLDDGVRRQAVQSCRDLLGEQVDMPATRRSRRR